MAGDQYHGGLYSQVLTGEEPRSGSCSWYSVKTPVAHTSLWKFYVDVNLIRLFEEIELRNSKTT